MCATLNSMGINTAERQPARRQSWIRALLCNLYAILLKEKKKKAFSSPEQLISCSSQPLSSEALGAM